MPCGYWLPACFVVLGRARAGRAGAGALIAGRWARRGSDRTRGWHLQATHCIITLCGVCRQSPQECTRPAMPPARARSAASARLQPCAGDQFPLGPPEGSISRGCPSRVPARGVGSAPRHPPVEAGRGRARGAERSAAGSGRGRRGGEGLGTRGLADDAPSTGRCRRGGAGGEAPRRGARLRGAAAGGRASRAGGGSPTPYPHGWGGARRAARGARGRPLAGRAGGVARARPAATSSRCCRTGRPSPLGDNQGPTGAQVDHRATPRYEPRRP